ncbi:MAG: ABC transporter permease [Phycisphaera sp.]|nr:MAG: ABC transporter permease [Phycisphaera sp.]
MSQDTDNNPQTADQLTAVTGVQLMQGIGHRPAEGFWLEAWRSVFKRPGAVLGIIWVSIIAFFAVFAPLVANGHPILLVEQGGVNPLGKLLGGLDEAVGTFDGARLVIFMLLWSVAWIMAPQRLHPALKLGTGAIVAIVFGLFVIAQFLSASTGNETSGLAGFLLGPPEDGVGSSRTFQIIIDLAIAAGLVWAAGTFELSRRVRIATVPVIVLFGLGSLLGVAARVDADTPVLSPMLEYLTVVDLTLLLGAVVALALLVPKWAGMAGGRGDRAKVLLTVSLQAGLAMLLHTIVSGQAAKRDAGWLRGFEQQPYFEVIAALGIAAIVGLIFVPLHPLTRLTNRAGVSLLVTLVMFGIIAARWSTPLPDFRYVANVAQGETSAIFTVVPWSPNQSGTAVDMLKPASNVYSQVFKGLEEVALNERARDTGMPVAQMPLDAEVLAAIEAQLGFASDSLPSKPAEAFAAVQAAADADPTMTVADAAAVLEARPGPAYSLGTDSKGRDMLSQLLHASRLSISIGLVSTTIAVVIGVTVGALMGYFGGWVDMLLYRVVEIFMAIPLLFLLIVAAAVLPRNTYVMMAIIGCVTWTGSARYIRAEFYKLRGQDFVQSARAVGLPLRSVLFKHMLPNGVTPVLVDASFAIAAAILAEAVLSYLGLGKPGQASWGGLLSDATNEVGKFMWWLAIFPGFAIFLTVLSYNLIGEALRDAIDPKLKKARV